MNDEEKTEVLRVSLLNIGRLLPKGVQIMFYHEGDDPNAHMEILYSDGTCTDAVFTSHSPVFKMPEMQP